MENIKNIEFPNGFFTKKRKQIPLEKALKNKKPFEWEQEVLNGNIKPLIVSKKTVKKLNNKNHY